MIVRHLAQSEMCTHDGRLTYTNVRIQQAVVLSQLSTCPRLHVACILCDDRHQVVSDGYNGAPRGEPHCTDVGCLLLPDERGCKRAVHAEENAVANAAYKGVSLHGTTAYLTHSPCRKCANLLKSAGVKEVIYYEVWYDDRAVQQS